MFAGVQDLATVTWLDSIYKHDMIIGSEMEPGHGSRVKALTRLFDPDSCSVLWKIVDKM